MWVKKQTLKSRKLKEKQQQQKINPKRPTPTHIII